MVVAEQSGATDLGAGSVLGGRYRLDSPIGEGGIGSVWAGTHLTLGRPVAVKLVEIPTMSEAFAREAQVAAAVDHRNVVSILDFGTEAGRPYMVMERLEGESLADLLCAGRSFTLAESIRLMARVLSGLGAVHETGIVHRDLKPENVFIVNDSDDEYPKLMDFGVSRSLQGEGGLRSVIPTQDDLLMGTPEYMSPEQARGLPDIDARSDIFSAGTMLYELLCGQLPFEADAPGDTIILVAKAQPTPIGLLRPDLVGPIVEVVERAMRREREDRFPTARGMRQALLEAAARTAATFVGKEAPTESVLSDSEIPAGFSVDLYTAIGDVIEPGDSSVIKLTEADLTYINAPRDTDEVENVPSPKAQRDLPTMVIETPPAKAPPPTRSWWLVVGAALVALALLGGVGFWVMRGDSASPSRPLALPTNAPDLVATGPTEGDHAAATAEPAGERPGTDEPEPVDPDPGDAPEASTQATDQPAPTEDASEERPATAEDTVTVHLLGLRQGAYPVVDGTRTTGDTLEIPRSDGTVEIEVRRRGYRTWRVEHPADEDATYTVQMGRFRRGAARRGRAARRGSRGASAPGLFSDPGF